MIGSRNSPLSMFDGGGDAFQRGMVIGNANSPFSTVADALRNTVDKYNAHLGAQQEQANKLDLIKQQYGMQGQNLISGIREKYNQSTPQLSPAEAAIDPMHPEDPKFIRNVGGVQMYPQPMYDAYGRIKGYKYVNPRALSMMDIIGTGGGGDNTADAQAAATLKELEDLQSGMPQGI